MPRLKSIRAPRAEPPLSEPILSHLLQPSRQSQARIHLLEGISMHMCAHTHLQPCGHSIPHLHHGICWQQAERDRSAPPLPCIAKSQHSMLYCHGCGKTGLQVTLIREPIRRRRQPAIWSLQQRCQGGIAALPNVTAATHREAPSRIKERTGRAAFYRAATDRNLHLFAKDC